MAVLRRHKPIDSLVLLCPCQAAGMQHVEAVLSNLASLGGGTAVHKLGLTVDHSTAGSDAQSQLTHLEVDGGMFPAHLTNDALRSSLPSVRSLCLGEVTHQAVRLVQSLGPQLTRLNLRWMVDGVLQECKALTHFHCREIDLDLLEVLVALPALTHVSCDTLGAAGCEAGCLKRMTCNWEEIKATSFLPGLRGRLLEEGVSLPRGVQTLVLTEVTAPIQRCSSESEDYMCCWASIVRRAAKQLQWEDGSMRLSLRYDDPRLSVKAASESARWALRALVFFGGQVTALTVQSTNCSSPTQFGADHVRVLGRRLGPHLTQLTNGKDVVLLPDAWAALPSAFPSLHRLVLQPESHGHNVAACTDLPACVSRFLAATQERAGMAVVML